MDLPPAVAIVDFQGSIGLYPQQFKQYCAFNPAQLRILVEGTDPSVLERSLDVRLYCRADPVYQADVDKLFPEQGRPGYAVIPDPREHFCPHIIAIKVLKLHNSAVVFVALRGLAEEG